MFGITYETWADVCQMYFDLGIGSKKAFLQWFPFSKLSKADEQFIASEEFYNNYISTASFVLYPEAMHCSENYLQKGDGSFRDSSLISPILYLVIQCIGKEISKNYIPTRNDCIDVFYAGNLPQMRCGYKQDYDSFYKAINSYIEDCQYFIKTDITSFFSNINLDVLIERIDKRCNARGTVFTPTHLKLYKELLSYCGTGRFPIIENSVASSFLATVVYLDEIDERIYRFINDKVSGIRSFKIIRYVDDMYILLDSDSDENALHAAYNQIRNEYSSILKEYGLALNAKKCCIKPRININDELKKSLYDEYFNGNTCEIEEFFDGAFQDFLAALLVTLQTEYIDVDRYNELIERHFEAPDIEFTPSEVFNHYIYENDAILQDSKTITLICQLINQDVSFISLDPKRLSVMIMKTKSSVAIKALLNQLFQRNRQGLWNSYDTAIAISYLIQSEFKHFDLLKVLGENSDDLRHYYEYCCGHRFTSVFQDRKTKHYAEIIDQDWKAYFLYFMYWIEKKRHNVLAEYAFFKNFFDRFTADMAFYYKYDPQEKRPNYNAFFKEAKLKSFYAGVDNSEFIIQNAHKFRNANPLSHASAELIDNKVSTEDLQKSITEMFQLINGYRTYQKKLQSRS